MTEPSARILILGAGSDIGLALARAYAQAGHDVILAARSAEQRLALDAEDLRLRTDRKIEIKEFDVLDIASFNGFLDGLGRLPEIVACVVGLLGDQSKAQTDPGLADLVMRSNFNGPALFLNEIASRMEARGSGQMIAVSSVAGERGRASNYVYGAAKAGFTAFLSGLRNRLAASNVRVMTVKPGFVNTRMTEGMKLPKLLTAQPTQVAAAILAAERKGRDVLYVLPVWRLIMVIIRAIPESIFKRLSL